MFFVYVLRSRISSWSYIGHTENLQKRIQEHNSGKTKSTKSRKPLDLVYFEQFITRFEAVNREKYLKSGTGREYLKNIIKIENASVVQLDTCLPTGREYQISTM